MKCFIIAAVSADGFIAQNEIHDSFTWTSKEDKLRYKTITKHARVIVVGKNTWKTFKKPLPDRLNIVYTRGRIEEIPGVETTQLSPHELLNELAERGFEEVAICGGSQINTLFMKAGVVDTIYLTVEPILFGKGISLFNEPMNRPLTLRSQEKAKSPEGTETGTLFMEYKVNFGGPAI